MNIKEIKEIIELMKENGIVEFELERDGLRISLKRGRVGKVVQEVVTTNEIPGAEKVILPTESKPKQEEIKRPENVVEIVSPMVGTFYAAPAPDAAPYVIVGQEVKPEDVVCIIEAMKVMNEIKAEVHGRIKEILVKNGEPVEYGQPLFLVEKL